MKPLRYWLAAATLTCVGLAGPLPADAAEDPPPDLVTETEAVQLSEGEADNILSPAERPDTTLERQAVAQYLSELPSVGSDLTAQDLEVGSIQVSDQVTTTVVVPEDSVEVRGLDVYVDAGSNEVSAAAELAISDTPPTTAGPGMGSWPSWVDVPSWALQLRSYVNGNFIGSANFQTQRRRYANDGSSAHDIWQVARYARASPDAVEINNAPDSPAFVKKLWLSSGLNSDAAPHGQQWRQDLTNPDQGFTNCSSSGASIAAGPFSFTPSDCSTYDVWQGAVGHQRFDFDQGSYAGGAARAVAYVSGFQIDDGVAPSMNWYEFVTFRLGHFSTNPEFKCSSDRLGVLDSTQVLECAF